MFHPGWPEASQIRWRCICPCVFNRGPHLCSSPSPASYPTHTLSKTPFMCWDTSLTCSTMKQLPPPQLKPLVWLNMLRILYSVCLSKLCKHSPRCLVLTAALEGGWPPGQEGSGSETDKLQGSLRQTLTQWPSTPPERDAFPVFAQTCRPSPAQDTQPHALNSCYKSRPVTGQTGLPTVDGTWHEQH